MGNSFNSMSSVTKSLRLLEYIDRRGIVHEGDHDSYLRIDSLPEGKYDVGYGISSMGDDSQPIELTYKKGTTDLELHSLDDEGRRIPETTLPLLEMVFEGDAIVGVEMHTPGSKLRAAFGCNGSMYSFQKRVCAAMATK